MRFTVIGAGSFGTAMARHITTMGEGHEVLLCCRGEDQARAISLAGRNPMYLRDVELGVGVTAVGGPGVLDDALDFSDRVIIALPSQAVAASLRRLSDAAGTGEGMHLLCLAKGIDIESGRFMHQLAAELLPDAAYSVLSGPSHAEELAVGMPTAVVTASADEGEALSWQAALNDSRLRVYTSSDVAGVELGGSMKNVIAIAVGVARAVGFGDNSVAALVTRGMAEIMRCGVRLGADPITLAGLAGIGDLMVTCYSELSRNFRFGTLIGRGMSATDACAEIGQVVEGMHTVRALCDIAGRLGLELPIAGGVYRVLYDGVPVRSAMAELMTREPKSESA